MSKIKVFRQDSFVCNIVGRYLLVSLTVPGLAQIQMTSQNYFPTGERCEMVSTYRGTRSASWLANH